MASGALERRRELRRHGWRARCGLLVVSTTLALLLLEAAVRLLDLAPDVRRLDVESVFTLVDNPALGYLHNPELDWVNSEGLADRERALAKPMGAFRMGLLGDSVISMSESLIHTRMEASLPAGAEVLNLGVSGYNTLMEAELLEVKGVRYGRLASLSVNAYGLRDATTAAADFASQLDDATHDSPLERGLGRIAELGTEHSFPVVAALWPEFDDESIGFPETLRQRVVARASELGLAVIDLAPPFREHFRESHGAAAASPIDRFTVGDGMHPNDLGADVAAESILSGLSELSELGDLLPVR